jgi:hypothetical protein
LQQQLDDSNAKLPEQFNVQNAEILKMQDQLNTSQAAQNYTATKLSKLIWFHLVAVALFYHPLTMIFRLHK